jgi:uncharacterized membrane protein YccC
MLHKRLPSSFAVLALAAVFVAGCSRNKSISRDQARSEIRSARSFAAELQMFINFVLEGRGTRHYAEEHTAYLEDAIEQLTKELEHAAPEPDAKDSIRECQTGLSTLARELSAIRTAIARDDKDALAAARGRVTQIRKSLENASSHL